MKNILNRFFFWLLGEEQFWQGYKSGRKAESQYRDFTKTEAGMKELYRQWKSEGYEEGFNDGCEYSKSKFSAGATVPDPDKIKSIKKYFND